MLEVVNGLAIIAFLVWGAAKLVFGQRENSTIEGLLFILCALIGTVLTKL